METLIIAALVIAGIMLICCVLLGRAVGKIHQPGQRRKGIVIILAIFFPGWDRLYTGSMGLAILKCITGYGLGIWWIVDIVKAFSGSYKDGDGYPLMDDAPVIIQQQQPTYTQYYAPPTIQQMQQPQAPPRQYQDVVNSDPYHRDG